MSKKLLESSNHTTRMDQLIAWVYAVIHKYGDGLCCTRGPSPNYSQSLMRSQPMDNVVGREGLDGPQISGASGQSPGWVTPGGLRDAPHRPGRAGARPAGQTARLGA